MNSSDFVKRYLIGWKYSLGIAAVAFLILFVPAIISTIVHDLPIFPISFSEIFLFLLAAPILLFIFLTPYYSLEIVKKGSGSMWLSFAVVALILYVVLLNRILF